MPLLAAAAQVAGVLAWKGVDTEELTARIEQTLMLAVEWTPQYDPESDGW